MEQQKIDSNKVIHYLRRQIEELQFQNTILRIQLEEYQKGEQTGDED